MTWLWHTSSSIVLAACCSVATLAASTVRGEVELVDSRDAGVRKHKDYSGVVIWLEPSNSNGDRSAAPPTSRVFEMRQKDKRFQPHLLVIPVGGAVAFPNLDPIFHNAFSNFNGQTFDVALYRPGSSRTVRFQRPGIVRVFCNIHPTMSAVIMVLKEPHFTITGNQGSFEITNVPAGEYRLHVFHERASAEALQSQERRIVVENGLLQLPPIKISEAGYLPAPHTNKHGNPYPRVIEDQRTYEGGER